MTKFELPEKPKKTNTSEDFNNLRKAVDELDKFDYAWKAYANKADRRINAANKYIEELERENQRLVAENLAIKALQQQPLPVVPEYVAEWIEHCKGMGYGLTASLTFKLSSTMHEEISAKILKWLGNEGNDETFALAFITGKYQVEKPQLFYLRDELTGQFLAKDNQFKNEDRYFFWNGADPLTHSIGTAWKLTFTQQEIKSIDERYWQFAVPVEDGE